jgi:hypothetical protein
MAGREPAGTEQADTGNYCASAACPVCGAAMEAYKTVSFDGTKILWIGTCPECGADVEGETLEKVHGLRCDTGAGGGACRAAARYRPDVVCADWPGLRINTS